jgi:outer membrane receptor protein involved in Fe transport
LRLRYFGPRDLTSDGINRSKATALLNAGLGYQFNKKWGVSTELLNLLNRKDDDITYAYVSRITPTAAPEFTNVSHPVRTVSGAIRVALPVRINYEKEVSTN